LLLNAGERSLEKKGQHRRRKKRKRSTTSFHGAKEKRSASIEAKKELITDRHPRKIPGNHRVETNAAAARSKLES